MFINSILLIHHINSLFCLLVGVSLNIFLIWLIFKQTSKEKQIYSQILIQTCIIDILLLIMSVLVQPVFFVEDGFAKNIMIGILYFLPNPFYHYIFIFWFIIFYFSLIGLGVQFIYRYLIICKDMNITSRDYFYILTASFFFQLPLSILLSIGTYPSTENEFLNNKGKSVSILGIGPSENNKWPIALFYDLGNPIVLSWIILFLLYNSLLYLIIFYCAAKIRKSINKQMSHLEISANSEELNRQITRTLLIQAILPAFPLLISSLAVISIFFSFDLIETIILTIQIFVTIPLSWVPMLNPFVSLIVIKHYRTFIILIIKKLLFGEKISLNKDFKTKIKILNVVKVNKIAKEWHKQGNNR